MLASFGVLLALAASSIASSLDTNYQITFYSYGDNDPPGNNTAINCGNRNGHASGVGTYDNPLTMALAPGLIGDCEVVYSPYLKKYLRNEDECATCTGKWIDIWLGPFDRSAGPDVDECQATLTSHMGFYHNLTRTPPANLQVVTAQLFDTKCHPEYVYPANNDAYIPASSGVAALSSISLIRSYSAVVVASSSAPLSSSTVVSSSARAFSSNFAFSSPTPSSSTQPSSSTLASSSLQGISSVAVSSFRVLSSSAAFSNSEPAISSSLFSSYIISSSSIKSLPVVTSPAAASSTSQARPSAISSTNSFSIQSSSFGRISPATTSAPQSSEAVSRLSLSISEARASSIKLMSVTPAVATSALPSLVASSKVSPDGTCGGLSGVTCKNSNSGNCCSQYGWCGNSSAYCKVERGCNSKFGDCWSDQSGGSASDDGNLVDNDVQSLGISPYGTCGPSTGFTCKGSSSGSCCSRFGWCGSTKASCKVSRGCQTKYGDCS